MKNIVILMALLFNSACTTSLYVARTNLPHPTKEKKCEVYTYWYTTSHPFFDKVGETYPVLMGEHQNLTFVKKENGIVYKGMAGADKLVGGKTPTQGEFLCGEFVGVKDIATYESEQLKVSMKCKKKSSPLTHPDRKNYLPYSKTPHILTVKKEKKEFFWFGGLPEAPKPPTCQ